ncbi:Ku protein [Candidatus Kaiserbacteria bacterium]|nr:Ku protein [Candidatus Kaiserbacteria bacterium]
MRAIWSGALTFGLVSIPVKLYNASEERALSFRLLDKHGHCPISYLKVCRGTNEEVKPEDIVKGYEYQKGDYVILTDEDFEKAAPKKTKTIDVQSFANEEEVESRFIEKPYYLEPDPSAEKAYVLLREALARSKKVGIGTFVLKDREHIAMLKPEGKALMLIRLRFEEELRKPTDLHIPESTKFSSKEFDLTVAFIKQLEEHFDASQYKDTYTGDLKKVIARKAKGKPIKVSEEEAPVPTDMRNLMEALRKSLEQERRPAHSGTR